jgi:hypothetical protein
MAFTRVTTDGTGTPANRFWAIPAVVSTTFSTPQTFYILSRGGQQTKLDGVTKKEQIDIGLIEGTYRNDFGLANLTAGSNGYVALKSGGGTTLGTDYINPDPIYGVAPRFLNKVQTVWRYTTSSGGVFDFPTSRWLSDSNTPFKRV